MALVAVYDRTTGRKHSVPEHWLDNPVLSKNLRKTPLSERAAAQASATDTKAPTGDDKKKEN